LGNCHKHYRTGRADEDRSGVHRVAADTAAADEYDYQRRRFTQRQAPDVCQLRPFAHESFALPFDHYHFNLLAQQRYKTMPDMDGGHQTHTAV
jgi:hypothetical protein